MLSAHFPPRFCLLSHAKTLDNYISINQSQLQIYEPSPVYKETERKIQRNNDIRVTKDDIDKLRGGLLASLVPHPMNSQTVKWQMQEIPDATVSTWRLYYEVSLFQSNQPHTVKWFCCYSKCLIQRLKYTL